MILCNIFSIFDFNCTVLSFLIRKGITVFANYNAFSILCNWLTFYSPYSFASLSFDRFAFYSIFFVSIKCFNSIPVSLFYFSPKLHDFLSSITLPHTFSTTFHKQSLSLALYKIVLVPHMSFLFSFF